MSEKTLEVGCSLIYEIDQVVQVRENVNNW